MSRVIDLGSGVTLRWLSWAPDRRLNPQYAGIDDVERYGAIVAHPDPKAETGICEGAITFRGAVQEELERRAHARDAGHRQTPMWDVASWEPLTLSPSILCGCGFHGFIRDGRWVPA